MSIFKLIKYVILCLKVGYYEHMGVITKEEGDRICMRFLDDL